MEEGMRGGIKRAVGNERSDVSVLWACDDVDVGIQTEVWSIIFLKV